MTSKDDSFKAYVVAKCGITALNMETMTLSRTRARVVRVQCSTWQHQILEYWHFCKGLLRNSAQESTRAKTPVNS